MARRALLILLASAPHAIIADLAAANQRKLVELLQRFARGGAAIERLCRAPWPCVADAPLRWLHIPKTGSTFTTTYTRYLCPSLSESVSIGKPVADSLRAWHWKAERSGPLAWDAVSLATAVNQTCGRSRATLRRVPHGAEPVCVARRERKPGEPKCLQDIAWRVRRHAHHQPFAPDDEAPAELAALFRAPASRLASAFYFGRHAWGLTAAEAAPLAKLSTPGEFARAPGISGCMTRMLSRCSCAARPATVAGGAAPDLSQWQCTRPDRRGSLLLANSTKIARDAAARVRSMAYVGVTELYNASVCLFHRRFGGTPIQAEFELFRVGRGHGHATPPAATFAELERTWEGEQDAAQFGDELRYSSDVLGDFTDELDEIVYAAALERFEADAAEALSEPRDGDGSGRGCRGR